MTNEERWHGFIIEIRDYIELHHHCANKHTDLYNRTRYYRRKMKDGSLVPDKAKVLEEILNMRDFTEHTGGRKTTRKCISPLQTLAHPPETARGGKETPSRSFAKGECARRLDRNKTYSPAQVADFRVCIL